MTHDLEKYGLLALGVVIVLILLIAISDLMERKDPGLKRIYVEDDPAKAALSLTKEWVVGPVVVVHEEKAGKTSGSKAGFDFQEPPVSYPGSSAAPASGGGDGNAKDALRGGRTHRVRKGETLSTISRRYYGTSGLWRRIVEANPGVDTRRLDVGRVLVIPPLSDTRKGTPGGTVSSSPSSLSASTHSLGGAKGASQRYRVHKGDTLGKIARRFYGDESAWKKILEANRKVIPDPKRLRIGVLLEIPR